MLIFLIAYETQTKKQIRMKTKKLASNLDGNLVQKGWSNSSLTPTDHWLTQDIHSGMHSQNILLGYRLAQQQLHKRYKFEYF